MEESTQLGLVKASLNEINSLLHKHEFRSKEYIELAVKYYTTWVSLSNKHISWATFRLFSGLGAADLSEDQKLTMLANIEAFWELVGLKSPAYSSFAKHMLLSLKTEKTTTSTRPILQVAGNLNITTQSAADNIIGSNMVSYDVPEFARELVEQDD